MKHGVVFCAGGAVVSALDSHVDVLGSIPNQGEIYMENSVSAASPAYSVVSGRLDLYVVQGKAARSDWPSPS